MTYTCTFMCINYDYYKYIFFPFQHILYVTKSISACSVVIYRKTSTFSEFLWKSAKTSFLRNLSGGITLSWMVRPVHTNEKRISFQYWMFLQSFIELVSVVVEKKHGNVIRMDGKTDRQPQNSISLLISAGDNKLCHFC